METGSLSKRKPGDVKNPDAVRSGRHPATMTDINSILQKSEKSVADISHFFDITYGEADALCAAVRELLRQDSGVTADSDASRRDKSKPQVVTSVEAGEQMKYWQIPRNAENYALPAWEKVYSGMLLTTPRIPLTLCHTVGDMFCDASTCD